MNFPTPVGPAKINPCGNRSALYARSSVSIGVGYGGGYGGYGYGGYGYGYPYGGYGYPYGGYGAYGSYDPFGWYGDYYYPGSGIYVYDSSRTRHVWNNDQQRYWSQRRQQWQNHGGATTSTGDNWSGWDRSRRRDNRSTTSGTWTRGGTGWTRGNTQSSTTIKRSLPGGGGSGRSR